VQIQLHCSFQQHVQGYCCCLALPEARQGGTPVVQLLGLQLLQQLHL
jgi:hypothetical protein